MNPEFQFYILTGASWLVFVAILRYVTRARKEALGVGKVSLVAAVVVPGGMLFARFAAQSGFPWWIYYTAPMLLTVFLPPIAFSMKMRETLPYVALAILSAPAIHIVFSFFFGWREYMPFLHIPSLQDLIGSW